MIALHSMQKTQELLLRGFNLGFGSIFVDAVSLVEAGSSIVSMSFVMHRQLPSARVFRITDECECIGWQSFADPADPRLIQTYFDNSKGPTGTARKGSAMLCVNPITGTAGGAAPASANRGALVPQPGMTGADFRSMTVSPAAGAV